MKYNTYKLKSNQIEEANILSCRLVELRNKIVICLKSGTHLGCVNDVEINIKTARVESIIVYGRLKCFGVFGREDDIVIKWEDIEIIGKDAILVNSQIHRRPNKCKKMFWKLYTK